MKKMTLTVTALALVFSFGTTTFASAVFDTMTAPQGEGNPGPVLPPPGV